MQHALFQLLYAKQRVILENNRSSFCPSLLIEQQIHSPLPPSIVQRISIKQQ